MNTKPFECVELAGIGLRGETCWVVCSSRTGSGWGVRARALEKQGKFHGGRTGRVRRSCRFGSLLTFRLGCRRHFRSSRIRQGLRAAFRTCPCQKNRCQKSLARHYLFSSFRVVIWLQVQMWNSIRRVIPIRRAIPCCSCHRHGPLARCFRKSSRFRLFGFKDIEVQHHKTNSRIHEI
jgi:hypothetical protein